MAYNDYATRTFHVPTTSPSFGANYGWQQPDLEVIGSTVVQEFAVNSDNAYRIFKIPSNFIDEPAFHVHWTKQEGAPGNGNEQGNSVRWRIRYTVWRSALTGVNSDLNVAPTVLDLDDTYSDSGTTSRIAERTANGALVGFVAQYYVGVEIEAVTPPGTPLGCDPTLISLDLTYRGYINLANT